MEDDKAGDNGEVFNKTETMFRVSDLIDRFDGVISTNFGGSDWISQFQALSLDASFRYISLKWTFT